MFRLARTCIVAAILFLTALPVFASPELWAAAERGDAAAVSAALEAGTDANAADADGWTALHFAAFEGRTAVVRLLLERGADPNAQAKDGATPLMGAAASGNVDVAKLLLAAGADPSKKIGRVDAAEIARRAGNLSVAELLGAPPSDAGAASDAAAATPETDPAAAEENALNLTREQRRALQQALTVLGYDTKGVDGSFGPNSRAAIAAYQAARGEPETGYFTAALISMLTEEAEGPLQQQIAATEAASAAQQAAAAEQARLADEQAAAEKAHAEDKRRAEEEQQRAELQKNIEMAQPFLRSYKDCRYLDYPSYGVFRTDGKVLMQDWYTYVGNNVYMTTEELPIAKIDNGKLYLEQGSILSLSTNGFDWAHSGLSFSHCWTD